MKNRLTVMFMVIGMATTLAFSDLVLANDASSKRSWNLGLSLGAGQRSNPLINGEQIDLWWSLDFAWFGEHLFFDNGDLGLTLSERSDSTLNWVARINTERAFFSEINEGLFSQATFANQFPLVEVGSDEFEALSAQEVDVPDRDYAFETGFEYLLDKSWGRVHAQAMFDVSSVHNGFDVWVNVSNDYVVGRWHIVPSLSMNWKSDKLNNYYYGVRENESSTLLPEYQASGGLNLAVKVSASYYISQRWRFMLAMDYESINSEAADSPLLEDDYIAAYFTGLHYAF